MKRMTSKTRLAAACGLGLAGMVAAGAAFAQEAAAARDADAESRAVTLDRVMVTAQKRSENIMEVPGGISVLTEGQLENLHATSLADYIAYIPGIQFDSGGTPGQGSLAIRGIAPVGPGATVATYIDDTPLGSSANFARSTSYALDLLPYDIETVEVLRGPQGTLYGAGSMGGLLKYVTRSPDLENMEGRAGFDAMDVDGAGELGMASRMALNVPLVEGKLAVRGSYSYQRTPGYIDNVLTGKDDINKNTQRAGRLALLWQPNEDVSLRLSGMWNTTDSRNNSTVALDIAGESLLYGDMGYNGYLDQPFRKDIAYYNAILDWNLGWADFVSATTYSYTETRTAQDATWQYGVLFPFLVPGLEPGLSRFDLELDLTKWTQEFRLTSKSGGTWEWLVGTFFTDEKSENRQLATAQFMDGTPIPGLHPLALAALPSTYRELAVFGDVTYRITPRFDISAGARFARNEQDFTQISSGSILPTTVTPGSSSESVFTYKLSSRWHFSEDTIGYARVATGYRPGGPNVVLPDVPPTVDSDTLVNYELGLKSHFWNRRAMIDVAAFLIDWEDIQVSSTNGVASFLINGGGARSQGLELSTVFMPAEGLRLGFNAAYTDAVFTGRDPNDPDDPLFGIYVDNHLPSIPEWSGSATVDYSFPVHGNWMGRIGGALRYADEKTGVYGYRSDSYTAIDLNADITNHDWTIRLFVKNLTNERVYTSRTPELHGFTGEIFQVAGTLMQPRTVGVALDVRF